MNPKHPDSDVPVVEPSAVEVFVIGGRRWVARTEMYYQPLDSNGLWGPEGEAVPSHRRGRDG